MERQYAAIDLKSFYASAALDFLIIYTKLRGE